MTDDGYVETMDTLDEEHSNWMIFVRPARTIMEQNLIAYQEDGNIFFVSLKVGALCTPFIVLYSHVMLAKLLTCLTVIQCRGHEFEPWFGQYLWDNIQH